VNGVAGDGWRSARARSAAAMLAVSELDRHGNLQCWGIKYIVSTISSWPVAEQYARWQR
jgi:uncharacterized membrane protein